MNVRYRVELSQAERDELTTLPEPAILGLVEGTSIQQVDLALRLLDEADDREKTTRTSSTRRRGCGSPAPAGPMR
jgi:hypothetical protein